MRTHDLAKALVTLAAFLREGPNVDVGNLAAVLKRPARKVPDDVEISLLSLAALSRIGKSEWANLISEWGFPIEIRATYSSRDVIGKLLNFLEVHPEAADMLRRRSSNRATKASPELLNALSVLLKRPL